VVVFGSDEIWNLNNCLGGIIDAYYFGENIKTKKISYATSFGSTSGIDESQEYIKNALLEFQYVSLRDKNSSDIMNNIGFKGSAMVLDPTFLLEQANVEPDIKTKYIFYYCVSKNCKLDEELTELSKKLGIEIIAFGYKHKKFKNIISIGPFEWLGYLKNAEYVVTNMFHGTIFSIKYRKKFIVEMTKYRENKLGFLLEIVNLRNRIYEKDELESILLQDVSYDNAFEKISKMKKISEEYIVRALQ
ncbi:MAG: polysaccharide pyruvyl transferase family protein, partial [Actinomycetia bacterium]|nr:polysaccharide pyruvyl transferase family protein [Actinomycetes bacterium]